MFSCCFLSYPWLFKHEIMNVCTLFVLWHALHELMVKDFDQLTLVITKVIWVLLIEGFLNCVEIEIWYWDCVWLYETIILPKGRSLYFKFTQGVIIDMYTNPLSMFVPKDTMLNCLWLHDLLVSSIEINSLRIEKAKQLWILLFLLKWNNNNSIILALENVNNKGFHIYLFDMNLV